MSRDASQPAPEDRSPNKSRTAGNSRLTGRPRDVPPVQPSTAQVRSSADSELPLVERETTAAAKARANSDTIPEISAIRLPVADVGDHATDPPAVVAASTVSVLTRTVPPTEIGPYRLLTCIVSGDTSQVWEALSADGERRIAVKLLLPESLQKFDLRRSMQREFRVGRQFDHPNIIKYLAGHWGTLFRREAYFSMELFLAPSLKMQLLHDFAGVQQRLTRIVETASAGLTHIHERGYLHRDIKPANLLVNKEGTVRIISFSLAGRPTNLLARLLGARFRRTQGTRSYMAPEQILKRPLSIPVDIYSFGVVLFEMLTGQLPFTAATPNELLRKHIQAPPPRPSQWNKKISLRLDRIVLRMLAKKPDQRYPNFGEFLADFEEATPHR